MSAYVSKGTLDFDQLTDQIKELLSRAWGEDWGTFTLEEPTGNDPEGIPLPVITYDTYERIRSKTHKSLDPILFDKRRDPDDPDSTIKLYRMWFDMEVDFHIYHQTNREARILMDEFETFLFAYKSYFKELGISDVIFLAETKPTVVTKWQKELPRRSLRYLVRIERITTLRSNNLQEVTPVKNENGRIVDDIMYDDSPLMNNYRNQLRIDD